MKTCTKCGVLRKNIYFVGSRGQETKQCETCRNHDKKYREENKEKIKERNKKYIEENKEKIREWSRAYGKNKYKCCCGKVLSRNSKGNHNKNSIQHKRYFILEEMRTHDKYILIREIIRSIDDDE